MAMSNAAWKRAAINITTATTTAVISTAADEFFEIKKLFLHSSGVNGVTLQSGSTVLCGKLDVVAQWRVLFGGEDDILWLRGVAVGDDFQIVTTQAVQLSGIVVYQLTN